MEKRHITSAITTKRQVICAITPKRQILCAITTRRQVGCVITEKRQIACVIMAKYFLVPLFYKRIRRFYVAHMSDRIVFSCSVFFLPKTSVTTQQRFEG